jgi:hypothetical protein
LLSSNRESARVAKNVDEDLDRWNQAYQRTWKTDSFLELFKNQKEAQVIEGSHKKIRQKISGRAPSPNM